MKLSSKHTVKTRDNLAPTTKILVSVPYRMPGNVIKQKDVAFEIFQTFNRITAIPLCDETTRDILNLPSEIVFYMVGDVVVGHRPALKDVSRNIAAALSSKHPLLLS